MHAFNGVHGRTGDEGRAMAAGHAAAKRCMGKKDMENKFTIFSGLLKAYSDTEGKKRLRTTASSTVKDLAGDVITESAIRKMAESAQNRMTVFLNHSYKVPEDIMGTVEVVEVNQRGLDTETGGPIFDLDFDVAIDESNPRAVQTWESVQRGTKLGTSIGAIVKDGKRNAEGAYLINDAELMEGSIVGLPMNPRSWVHYAVKSLQLAEEEEGEAEPLGEIKEMPSDGIEKEVIEASAEGSESELVSEPTDEEPAPALLTSGVQPITSSTTTNSNMTFKFVPIPDLTDQEKHDSEVTEDPIEKARVTVWEDSDTTTVEVATRRPSGSQEASASDPGDGLMDEDRADAGSEPDAKALGDQLTREAPTEEPGFELKGADLATLLENLQVVTRELVAAQTRAAAADEARRDAEERTKRAEATAAMAKQLFDAIADLPLGRRTAFKEATVDFRAKFGQIYSDDVLKLMENKPQ